MVKRDRDPTQARSGRKPDVIDARAVKAAFCRARWPWSVPVPDDLARLAFTLESERARVAATAAMPPRAAPDAATRRRIVQAERVRDAVGVLLRDLPDLAAHAAKVLPTGNRHAEVLMELLGSARVVSAYWTFLDGRHRRLDRRSGWAIFADCLAYPLGLAITRANPTTRIAAPLKGDTPTARLMSELLAMVGHDVGPDAIAQHYRRTPRQFFSAIWGAQRDGTA